MGRGFALFLARLLSTKNRNLFATRLGVALLLAQFGLTGPVAQPLNFLLRSLVGVFIEYGIYQIDLTVDSWREGRKLKEFEKIATEEYEKTISKVFTEEEKVEIRKQYLHYITRIGAVGNPK